MQIDGNKIQREIKQELQQQVAACKRTPRLDILCVGSDSVIETFTKLKQDFGSAIGAEVVIHKYSPGVAETKLKKQIRAIARKRAVDGMIMQLPLPAELDQQSILNIIPANKDVDLLSDAAYKSFAVGDDTLLPPVVGVVEEIFAQHDIDLAGKSVAVVGRGRLVGQPVIDWLQQQDINPAVFEKGDDLTRLHQADIIISGAGDPHIITPEHITEGVILLDAGTSHADGSTRGDTDPACADKASLYSPVPGGIGPITVAKLFENVVTVARTNQA
jgi:methylenetetrahydrofolate dehydrogenase (NADP+)/methenyltetrahydrofolate cyclohydrolase